MFLFRWIWQLFRAVLSLLLLPLRLLGIPASMIWFPFYFLLKMFARHTVAFLVVVVLIILFFQIGRASCRERVSSPV